MSWCLWHFLTCYGDSSNHPKALAIAVTRDNLRDAFWPEMSKWMNQSRWIKEHFEWTKERIFHKSYPEDWFLSARSWPQSADSETQGKTLSGIHAKYVMFMIDESAEIPTTVLRAAEQALSETGVEFGRIIQSGNPTSKNGMLYAASRIPDQWEIISITGDPEDPMRSPRIDMDWAKKQIEQYGRDNSWVQTYILGQFPTSSTNTLLSPEEVEEAMGRSLHKDTYIDSEVRLGIDVARQGDDSTVIFRRQGLRADWNPIQMRNVTGKVISDRIISEKGLTGSAKEFIDDTGGWGASAIDFLNTAGYRPVPVNFSQKANDAERYFNRRAEMLWSMAEWVKKGGSLPNMPHIANEFHAPEYSYKGNKILIEPKELYKKRIGKSPDFADALALTFALPEQAKAHPLDFLKKRKHTVDFDPFGFED